MPTVDIRNISNLDDMAAPGMRTLIIRPAGYDTTKLDDWFYKRSAHYASFSRTLSPIADEWLAILDHELRVVERHDDFNTLIVLPDVHDSMSADVFFKCSHLCHFAVSIIAASVQDAVLKIWEHEFDSDLFSRLRFLDLTGDVPSQTIDLPRKEPRPTPASRDLLAHAPMSLDTYVSGTRTALIERWRGAVEDQLFIGVRTSDDFARRFRKGFAKPIETRFLDSHSSSSFPSLGANDHDAFTVVTDKGLLEVWINAELSSHRYRPIFENVVKPIHGFNLGASGGYDLDHSFGRKAALQSKETVFVLLVPVESSVNRSWSYIEKMVPHEPRSEKGMQLATWFTIAKLLGVSAPSMRRDKTLGDGIDRVGNTLIEKGAIDSGEMPEAVDAMKYLYASVWRGRQKLRGEPLTAPPDTWFDETRAMRRRAAKLKLASSLSLPGSLQ